MEKCSQRRARAASYADDKICANCANNIRGTCSTPGAGPESVQQMICKQCPLMGIDEACEECGWFIRHQEVT